MHRVEHDHSLVLVIFERINVVCGLFGGINLLKYYLFIGHFHLLFGHKSSQVIENGVSSRNVVTFVVHDAIKHEKNCEFPYRSGTVNSKSFVGKVLLRIKWKFELIDTL